MRIRTIKPEFWMHEKLAEKSEFTRLLAIAILNWADDEGYFMANPTLIKGQLFPFLDDSKIIPRSIQDLSSVGWIELSEDEDGRSIGRVTNFAKHQRVDKPKPSIIKPLWGFQDASKTHPRSIQDASKEEGKGKEGNRNGKEGITCLQADDSPIDLIWKLSHPTGKSRSSRKQLAAAWKAIPAAQKPSVDTLTESLGKWLESADWAQDDGKYVPGIHLWIKNRKWEVEPTKSKSHKNRFAGTQEEIELP
jgi:DNA replication protein DnaT